MIEHTPQTDEARILDDLFISDTQNPDFTVTKQAFRAEMFVEHCGAMDRYQIRCSYFGGPFDGADDGESAWVYTAEKAVETWKHFTYYECPIDANQIAIRASENYLKGRG